MKVDIHPSLRPVLRVGVLETDGMTLPQDDGAEIWQMLVDAGDDVFRTYANQTASDVAGVQMARALYRSIGIDPTKTRPSSEALLRRSMKGKGLFRIHPLVDLLNWVSLKWLMPVGLYDIDKIIGASCTIQIGETGWGFEGIRKARVNVDSRICIADAEGPFGSPTSDSLRTSIEGQVSGALILLYQSAHVDATPLHDAMVHTSSQLKRFFACRNIKSGILSQSPY